MSTYKMTMRNKRQLVFDQLDRNLKPFQPLRKIQVPSSGWIRYIRTSLNMSQEQLGKKLGMTKQAVSRLEMREARGTVTVKVLQQVAKALEMEFVYGFVPEQGSVEELVEDKARKLAERIVLRTNTHMKLEDQGISTEKLKSAVEELTEEYKRELPGLLWD